ncbi:MAG: molybdopterin-dependent oxidoreductase [Alphaproteobacteria bacterium]
MSTTQETIRTTCPRDCYDACGIVAVKRDGQLAHIVGDPDHHVSRGKLCGKCAIMYNGVYLDPAARLTRPLKRVGPKGEGHFAPLSWDEALSEIGSRLGRIAREEGGQRIVYAHYTGTRSFIASHFPRRLMHRLGAHEADPDSICNSAGQVALEYVIGHAALGFDPRTAKDAACILVWGANPHASAPHMHSQWLRETKAKVVVIDPIAHPTAKQADLHLQPFPGSDAALAFAMMHVLKAEGLIDRGFLAEHTVGWLELEALIEPTTPAWAEAQTGVPAEKIVEAARLYRSGPALLWLGQALQRQGQGGNITRACALLPAVTGNFGKPGAGLLYLNGSGRRGVKVDELAAKHLSKSPPAFSHMDLAARLEDAEASKAFICWNINPAASNPEQRRLHDALRRDDLLTVVADVFQTDTTDFADYVLPAASFLEFDDLVTSYFDLTFSAQRKVAEPMGEALPNQEIFRRLAKTIGLNDPELYEPDAQIIGRLLEQVGWREGFAALAARGTVFLYEEPVIQFEGLRFPTPSGKIEIASEQAERNGHGRLPRPSVDARPSGGRFRLLSPASEWTMNCSYANDPTIRRRLGKATVAINPRDAEAAGLRAGGTVRVHNETGELALQLAVSADVPPGVALAHKGRWPRLAGPGEAHANVNWLNPGEKADMGESTAVHAVEVMIEHASA